MIFKRKCDPTAVKTGTWLNPSPTRSPWRDSTVGNVINAVVLRDVSKLRQLIRHQRARHAGTVAISELSKTSRWGYCYPERGKQTDKRSSGGSGCCTMKQLGGNTSNDVPQLLKFTRQDSTSRSSLIFINGLSNATKTWQILLFSVSTSHRRDAKRRYPPELKVSFSIFENTFDRVTNPGCIIYLN